MFRVWGGRGGSRFHRPNPAWIDTATLLENCSRGGGWRRLVWVEYRSFVIPITVFLAASLTTLLTSSGITFGQPVAAPSGAAGQISEIDKLIETKRLQEAGDQLQQEIRAHGESYGTLFL